MSEIIKCNGAGSTLENLQLHRKKRSKLIINVILPALEEELLSELEQNNYCCVRIHESTDIASDKV